MVEPRVVMDCEVGRDIIKGLGDDYVVGSFGENDGVSLGSK